MATKKTSGKKNFVYTEPKSYFPKHIQKILDEGEKKKNKGNKK